MKKIKIGDTYIEFIKRQNQKTIRLTLNKNNQIVLSAPYFCSEKKAIDFATQHQDWIKKHTIDKQEKTFNYRWFMLIKYKLLWEYPSKA